MINPSPSDPVPPLPSVPTAPAHIAAPETAADLPAPALTPEEQMALYEKELKETDWGHQPC